MDTIDIEMMVEKEDVTGKVTYKKIKEYVQEKYGFKVHTAHIAEVKRKHGLPMHEASNSVEKRKHEYIPCSAEKMKAIEAAFEIFSII